MKSILFICIGDSKIIGDSLGPVIGSTLNKNKKNIEKLYHINIETIGTIENPLIYSNVKEKALSINKKYNLTVIIDSALGNKNHIGKIIITSNKIDVGKGTNVGRTLEGDIIIKGIVAEDLKNIRKNIFSLNCVKLDEIEKLSRKIINVIYEIFNIELKYKNMINGNNFYIDNI